MKNAYSFENTSKFNAFGQTSSKDVTHALIEITEPTNEDNSAEFNSIKSLTLENTNKGIVNTADGFNDFEIIGEYIIGGKAIEEFFVPI